MSIFKKLFNRPDFPIEREQVHRSVRVKITELHRVTFRPIEKSQNIRVGNISSTGMGLLRPDLEQAELGQVMRGNLEINQTLYDVQAAICHVTNRITGCKFVDPSEILEKAIQEYFRMEIIGLSLNPVNEAFLKNDPSGRPFWFTDSRQNEIYFTTDSHGINNFHISFFGNYLEGGRGKRVRTGHVIDHDDDGRAYRGSAMIQLEEAGAGQMKEMALVMVKSTDKMSPEHQEAFLKFLSGDEVG